MPCAWKRAWQVLNQLGSVYAISPLAMAMFLASYSGQVRKGLE